MSVLATDDEALDLPLQAVQLQAGQEHLDESLVFISADHECFWSLHKRTGRAFQLLSGLRADLNVPNGKWLVRSASVMQNVYIYTHTYIYIYMCVHYTVRVRTRDERRMCTSSAEDRVVRDELEYRRTRCRTSAIPRFRWYVTLIGEPL